MQKLSILPFAACLVASTAFADDARLSVGDMNRLLQLEGQDYIDTANRILDDDAMRASIVSEAKTALFSKERFERQAVIAALAARAEHPDEVARLGELKSLEPSVYLAQRRPLPAAGRELIGKNLPLGALLEAWLWPSAHLAKHDVTDYPAGDRARVRELMAMEAQAFDEGVLMALAETGHPAAAFALLKELDDAKGQNRAIAAVLLGRCDAALVRDALVATLNATAEPYALREAALVGLGKLRDAKATVVLANVAKDGNATFQLRKAAIVSLGQSGSKWGHAAGGKQDAATIRATALETLLALVPEVAGGALAEPVRQSLVLLEDEAALATLEQMAKNPAMSATVRADAERAARSLRRALRRQSH